MKSFEFIPLSAMAALAVCVSGGANAQPVYRCGNSYSQSPCAGATVIQADDARTDAQRAAAKEALSRNKALGKEMETSRRKDEAQALAQEKLHLAAQAKADAKARQEAQKREHEKARKEKAEAKQRAGGKMSHGSKEEPGVFTVAVPGTGKPTKSK